MTSMQMQERTLAERLKRQIHGSRSRAYWLTVLVVAAFGVTAMMLWPARRERPVLDRPTEPRPEFHVFRVTDVSGGQVERLNLSVLVRPGMSNESLLAALSWALYSTLDEYNRKLRRRVRVIWAYAVEDSAIPLSRWRALAIWADPNLPERLQPVRSGGDAVRVGPIEYDFTNPLREFRAAGHQTSIGRWS
jgi:hypothetical protein